MRANASAQKAGVHRHGFDSGESRFAGTKQQRPLAPRPVSPVQYFADITPEPGVELVRECVAAARSFNPDVIIGLGGGSNMDTAKLVSMILAHGKDPLDYTGDCRVPGPVKPLICIPTTAGTGSEVSAAAVFTDTEKQIKVKLPQPVPALPGVRNRRSAVHGWLPAKGNRRFRH